MAYMIPSLPMDYDVRSKEDLMFDALRQLPDDFYVFHSFRIYKEKRKKLFENEMDFVIYNRSLGILVLECKAGNVHYDLETRKWEYGNGIAMSHNGPFNQANNNMYNIKNYIEDTANLRTLTNRCRFRSGVWFVDLTKHELDNMHLPSNVDKKMILTSESVNNPLYDIKRIFSMERYNECETNLSEKDHKIILERVLCPQVDIVATIPFETTLKKYTFNRLIKEQVLVLNFLLEQKFAVINGAAGTGKTMIAIEKAKRDAANGEKVLFLCFNEELCKYLLKSYDDMNIDFFTINGYACSLLKSGIADFKKLKQRLEEYYISEDFPYNHIVIDEGQDFGMKEIENNDILKCFVDIIRENKGSSMFMFYDSLQKIQSRDMPKVINEADCKITLYRNCRNTKNIAETSLRPITSRKVEMKDDSFLGTPATLHFCENQNKEVEVIDNLIEKYTNEGYKEKNIVILTCKTKEKSLLANLSCSNTYKKCHFTTCRKFKGLESDIIIMIDVDEHTFQDEEINKDDNKMMFYVGASRARFYLDIITSINSEQCKNIMINQFRINKRIKNSKRELASKLNTIAKIHD